MAFGDVIGRETVRVSDTDSTLVRVAGEDTNIIFGTVFEGAGLVGSNTDVGTLVKVTNKVVAGIITNTGALAKVTSKILVGVITNIGNVVKVKRRTNFMLMDVGIGDTAAGGPFVSIVFDVELANEDE